VREGASERGSDSDRTDRRPVTPSLTRSLPHSSLRPGDRVRILHCPAGWLPQWLLGTFARVERVNAAGVTLATEEVRGSWKTRYVPRALAHCLERER